MQSTIKRFFWCEAALAGVSATTFLLTLLWPHWVELVFGVDLDHGSGSVEWFVTLLSGVAMAGFGLLTRYAWRLRQQPGLAAATEPQS